MKRRLIHIFRTFPLTLLCVALVWYLCLLKPPSMRVSLFASTDKVVHVLMYLGLCGTLWWEYHRSTYRLPVLRRWLCFILLPVLMSGVIELLQEYATLYRSGDWRDLAANTLGVLMGAAWGEWWLPWWMKRRNGAKSGGGASK